MAEASSKSKRDEAFDTRLRHVETEITALGSNVEAIEASVRGLGHDVRELTASLGQSKQTDWRLVLTAFGLALTIGSLSASVINMMINGVQSNIDTVDRRLQAIEVLALERAGVLASQNQSISALQAQLDTRSEIQNDMLRRLNEIGASRYTPDHAQKDDDQIRREMGLMRDWAEASFERRGE